MWQKRDLGERRDFTQRSTRRRCWGKGTGVQTAFTDRTSFLLHSLPSASLASPFHCRHVKLVELPEIMPSERGKRRARVISTNPNHRLSPLVHASPGAHRIESPELGLQRHQSYTLTSLELVGREEAERQIDSLD